jgi:hypothetical protein
VANLEISFMPHVCTYIHPLPRRLCGLDGMITDVRFEPGLRMVIIAHTRLLHGLNAPLAEGLISGHFLTIEICSMLCGHGK